MSNVPKREGRVWGDSARDWAQYQEATLQPMFETVLAQTGVGAGSAVLDVACGTGLFLTLAQARGATVAGLDASAGQLEVTRERLPESDIRQGEMDELPFDDDQFDLVTICNALQYANDVPTALREMKRVAHSGGTVGVLTVARTSSPSTGVVFGAFNKFREQQANDAPPPAPSPSRIIFSDPEAVLRFMNEVGLEVYTDVDIDTPWNYPDLESALRGSLSFAPGVRAIRSYGQDAVYEAVGEALEPFRTADGGYSLPNRARYVLARVP